MRQLPEGDELKTVFQVKGRGTQNCLQISVRCLKHAYPE